MQETCISSEFVMKQRLSCIKPWRKSCLYFREFDNMLLWDVCPYFIHHCNLQCKRQWGNWCILLNVVVVSASLYFSGVPFHKFAILYLICFLPMLFMGLVRCRLCYCHVLMLSTADVSLWTGNYCYIWRGTTNIWRETAGYWNNWSDDTFSHHKVASIPWCSEANIRRSKGKMDGSLKCA